MPASRETLRSLTFRLVAPQDMLAELHEDNKQLTASMREPHELCDEYGDVATASVLENWIDDAERRVWFLFECGREGWRDRIGNSRTISSPTTSCGYKKQSCESCEGQASSSQQNGLTMCEVGHEPPNSDVRAASVHP